ncbi:CBS domain-containing protein [Limnoglobus roseus]|uniref:CBS domain-containing protein n=1 Tax=Limnoglobus roseus TaxID=2598579 RepID=A0A5C1ABI4_9BACT|nr:CBS domain-containing protein [Limnoglobus roseus]QEL16739.1 hypothetical protein PX52LOC_03705 [Limnoglobus roseus]
MDKLRKPLYDLSARDLMCRDLTVIRETAPVQEAAAALRRAAVHGAPVVDLDGRCVGVLTLTDLLNHATPRAGTPHPLPIACPFQDRVAGGHGEVICQLPDRACTLQRHQRTPAGQDRIVCRDPHTVATDWQVFDVESLPPEDVAHVMTPDPVTIDETADVRSIARRMTDAGIHRVIVVDAEARPVGVVSGTDLIAAIAYAVEPTRADLCGWG